MAAFNFQLVINTILANKTKIVLDANVCACGTLTCRWTSEASDTTTLTVLHLKINAVYTRWKQTSCYALFAHPTWYTFKRTREVLSRPHLVIWGWAHVLATELYVSTSKALITLLLMWNPYKKLLSSKYIVTVKLLFWEFNQVFNNI